jgi:hypothetical protein
MQAQVLLPLRPEDYQAQDPGATLWVSCAFSASAMEHGEVAEAAV